MFDLSEFLSSYFDQLWQILLLPLKLIVALVTFLGIIANFVGALISGIWNLLVALAALLPDFMIPFLFIISCIRIFKFLSKRHNNFVRS